VLAKVTASSNKAGRVWNPPAAPTGIKRFSGSLRRSAEEVARAVAVGRVQVGREPVLPARR